MYHELLIALRGHPGLIFPEKDGVLRVNKSISELHPCEVVIINQLLEVASDYMQLHQYINENRYRFDSAMYLAALYEGVDNALEPYRQTLVTLEYEILEHAGAQLSLLQHRLIPHRPILRALVQLLKVIEEDEPRGCMILDKVYKASASGVEGVGVALKKVLSELNKVLYKQLLAWLLQGSLYDPFHEFFIIKDSKADESILIMGDEGERTRSKSGSYQLKLDLVPAHISPALAEKIFFIGESIQLFESDRRVESQGAVLRDKEAEFYQELARLRDKEMFEVQEFASFVDQIREAVSLHLHNLVMVEADLKSELSTVWNIFLLGRGELFHEFIRLAEDRMSKPPTITSQNDANQSWRSSLQLVLSNSEEDTMLQKAKIVIGNEPKECWDQLSIQYAVSWPLHLVITPGAISKYNKIFSLLLLMRRSSNALNFMWTQMMNKGKTDEGRGVNWTGQLWQTRLHMAFLIANIQSYVLSDVLESQKSSFLKKLEETKSFETIKEAHEQFLIDVSTQIFLQNPKILKLLKDLLKATLVLVKCASYNIQEAGQLCHELNQKAMLLLQLLTSMRQKVEGGNHLAQLLLRLDFNRYFSANKKIQEVKPKEAMP